ncbi:hypothetical protein D9757_010666 [Collybiopsis confluens]|uniref:Uncharacterized protein n=1 Tax=Collybiopsis confluens TaxID=2823264 RepID=A0A8H5GMP8_9AGAR|nr:hypothetical protein D9757_010666 [Collybiopsis confluens]
MAFWLSHLYCWIVALAVAKTALHWCLATIHGTRFFILERLTQEYVLRRILGLGKRSIKVEFGSHSAPVPPPDPRTLLPGVLMARPTSFAWAALKQEYVLRRILGLGKRSIKVEFGSHSAPVPPPDPRTLLPGVFVARPTSFAWAALKQISSNPLAFLPKAIRQLAWDTLFYYNVMLARLWSSLEVPFSLPASAF